MEKIVQRRSKFSGRPSAGEIFHFLLGGSVVDLQVTVAFLPAIVNDLSGNDILWLPTRGARRAHEARHEFLTDKVWKLAGESERGGSRLFDQGVARPVITECMGGTRIRGWC